MLVVHRNLGGVRGSVDRLGERSPAGARRLEGTCIRDFGGSVVAESTVKSVSGDDIVDVRA